MVILGIFQIEIILKVIAFGMKVRRALPPNCRIGLSLSLSLPPSSLIELAATVRWSRVTVCIQLLLRAVAQKSCDAVTRHPFSIKIYQIYFKDKWHLFDAIVIAASIVLLALDMKLDNKNFKTISKILRGIFRFLRLFLVFRKVRNFVLPTPFHLASAHAAVFPRSNWQEQAFLQTNYWTLPNQSFSNFLIKIAILHHLGDGVQ